MKLIIDVPDNVYAKVMEYYKHNEIVEAVYGYIYRGTPIPDNAKYKAESEDKEIKSVFTAEERADIMNAINEAFDQKNMNIDAVGYDDTNGVWLDVMVMKK